MMKRLGLALCLGMAWLGLAAGLDDYVIVLPEEAIPAEVTAAGELADHLELLYGVRVPVVAGTAVPAGKAVMAVGFGAHLPEALRALDTGGFGEEELLIASPDGADLLLAGGRPRGALYAVYEYLEMLGVRWYTPTETFIPENGSFAPPPAGYHYRYASPFVSRTQVSGNGETPQWCARNRMNSFREWVNPGEEYGGGVFQGPGMETFFIYLKKPDMDRHPEWLAEVDGVREASAAGSSWGVCLSNEALRAELVNRALAWARKNPAATAVWLAQNDGSPYCTCAECREFYDAHGGQPSSMIVLLLNELAARVAEEFPAMRVKTLAYSWSLTPPENIKLADNVTVMFCATIDHRATLGRDPQGDRVIANYRDWQRVAGDFEVYLYGYPANDYFSPSPCLYSQARNIRWTFENGIKSLHHQFFGFYNSQGGDLVYLRLWLYTRLAWNPSLDPESLIEEFCRDYYGEGAPALLEAIRVYHRRVESGDLSDFDLDLPFLPPYVDVELAQQLSRRLESTWRTLRDPVIKERFAYAMLPMLWAEYWGNFPTLCQYDRASKSWGVKIADRSRCAEVGRLIREIMIANGITALGERKSFNPAHLRLDELAREYPAYELSNDRLSVVAVPGCYGKMVDFRLQSDGFSPIKPAWGHVILQYPRFGYWSDYYNGLFAEKMTVTGSTPASLAMECRRADGVAAKSLELEGDVLLQRWSFTPKESTECRIRVSPLLDLGETGFGIYPVLRVGLNSGGWRETALGRAGCVWYQGGGIDLGDFNGTLELVSEDGGHTLVLTMDPGLTGTLSYMYDRYDCKPEGTNRILELNIETIGRETAAGTPFEFAMTMQVEK